MNHLINGSIDILNNAEDSSIARKNPDSLVSLPVIETRQPRIITPYDCSLERSINESYKTDLLESVTGFLPDVWIISMISLITIAMLINIHMKINQVSKPWMIPKGGFWTVISFLLKNPAMTGINFVSSILSTLIAIFVFLVGTCYFENVIKSNQISIYQPTVYTSYAMIAEDPKIQVTTYSIQFENFCKQQPPHSKYRRIFENNYKKWGGMKMNLMELNLMKMNLMKMNLMKMNLMKMNLMKMNLMKMNLMKILDWFLSTPRGNKAFIHYSVPGSAIFFCKNKYISSILNLKQWKLDDLCLYEHVPQFGDPEKDDLEALVINRANLISLNFTRKKIFKKFISYFNREHEMALHGMGPYKERVILPSNASCVPQKPLVTHDRGSLPFDLFNYKFSFVLIAVVSCIALVILMIEIWHYGHHFSDNTPHKIIEISVKWKPPKENHSSIASTARTMIHRDDFVKILTQSVANKKPKLTEQKDGNNSMKERHKNQMDTKESDVLETDTVKTDTIKTDAKQTDRIKTSSMKTRAIKTCSTPLKHTPKMVIHVADVHSTHSTSKRVSSGKNVEKKLGRNRNKIAPISDDTILTEETQKCKE